MRANFTDAACAGMDVNLFDVGPHEDKAKAICATCPITNLCLTYALQTNEQYLIFGGLNPAERKLLKSKLEGKHNG